MSDLTDIELVELAVSGDAKAFSHVVERHYMMVYKVAYKWCRSKEDAEDIAQEVFVKVGRKISSFRSDSAFNTWLYRIAVNTAKDLFRKQEKDKNNDPTILEKDQLQDKSPNQEESLVSRQVYDLIDKLPKKLKEATLLVFGEELSHKEAAEILGCAETTISWRIFQAKKKLKKYLQE